MGFVEYLYTLYKQNRTPSLPTKNLEDTCMSVYVVDVHIVRTPKWGRHGFDGM